MFSADDMERWPMGVEKSELIDGEVIFYGSFDQLDVQRAEAAWPGHRARLESYDGGYNLVLS